MCMRSIAGRHPLRNPRFHESASDEIYDMAKVGNKRMPAADNLYFLQDRKCRIELYRTRLNISNRDQSTANGQRAHA